MAELVDALGLGPSGVTRGGSNPFGRTSGGTASATSARSAGEQRYQNDRRFVSRSAPAARLSRRAPRAPMRPLPTRSPVSRVPLPRSPALRTQATLARMVVGIFGHIRGGSWIEKQHDVLHLRSDLFEHFEPLRGHGSFRNHSLRQRRQSARQGPRCRPVGRPTTHPTWAGFAVAVGLRGWPCSAAFDPRAPSLTSSQLSANRSQTCAMWARVAPASRSLNVPAISRQARRRYPSALLATIHSPRSCNR